APTSRALPCPTPLPSPTLFRSTGDEPGVGPAEAQGHSESLRRPDGDVGPPLPRRREQGERQQVGRSHHHRTGLLEPGGGLPVVRSEEHTSELQSRENLVCRLLL